jgi:hypothetical protein
MNKNREGFYISETERECTKCHSIFKKTSKTVTLCNKCNTDRVKSYTLEYKMIARAKSRARIKNIEFNIDLTDIQIPEYCPILEIPLLGNSGRPGGKVNSPALDRIDCKKGYIKGNVRVISHLANMMKSCATNEHLIIFSKWVIINVNL